MPDVLLTPIYTVRVTNTMVELLADKRLTTATLVNLPELARLATLEDVFYHIYAQTDDIDFVSLTNKLGVKSFMLHPANVEWLNSVKDQYNSYVQRREDEKKIHNIPTKVLHGTIHTAFELLHGKGNIAPEHVSANGCFYVCFSDTTETLKHTKSDSGLDELNHQFKKSIYSLLYDYMGFEALRQHIASRYLLAPGV